MYSVYFQHPGSGTAKRKFLTFTPAASDTWERIVLTVTGDTAVAFPVNVSTYGLGIYIYLDNPPNYDVDATEADWQTSVVVASENNVNFMDNTSNELYMTGCQLEVSDSVSDFEFLPHDVQLQRCYRYCQRHPSQDPTGGAYGVIASGHNSGTTAQLPIVHHYIPMRGDPSLTNSGNFRVHHANTNTATSAATTLDDNTSSPSISLLVVTVSSGLTVGQSALYEQNNDSDAHILLDADL